MSDTAQIMLRAYRAGIALPAFNIPYLPMLEPVAKAIIDQDSFALIEVARLEYIKFEARSAAAVMAEFRKWQDPGHMRLHQDHVPVIDEDQHQDRLPVRYPDGDRSGLRLGDGRRLAAVAG